MALEDVCEHTAVPARTRIKPPGDSTTRIDGERDTEEQVDAANPPTTAFDCALFLPIGTEDTHHQRHMFGGSRPGRNIQRPTLLYLPEDRAGNALRLSHEDRLMVTATEVTGADPVEWKIDGSPQPFGRPGDDLVGWQAKLVRVME